MFLYCVLTVVQCSETVSVASPNSVGEIGMNLGSQSMNVHVWLSMRFVSCCLDVHYCWWVGLVVSYWGAAASVCTGRRGFPFQISLSLEHFRHFQFGRVLHLRFPTWGPPVASSISDTWSSPLRATWNSLKLQVVQTVKVCWDSPLEISGSPPELSCIVANLSWGTRNWLFCTPDVSSG